VVHNSGGPLGEEHRNSSIPNGSVDGGRVDGRWVGTGTLRELYANLIEEGIFKANRIGDDRNGCNLRAGQHLLKSKIHTITPNANIFL
jgi:hypothetical protein